MRRTVHSRARPAPAEEELRSWENSWPALVKVLGAAGLGELQLLLEYELPGSSQRIDALILGTRAGRLSAVVVELKQWTTAAPHPAGAGMLRVGGREVLHPARQVGGYVTYLTHWVPAELGLEVRGLAFLHNASAELVGHLREQTADGPSAFYPLLGAADLALDVDAPQLAERLQCTGLEPADRSSIDGFLRAHHRPSRNFCPGSPPPSAVTTASSSSATRTRPAR